MLPARCAPSILGEPEREFWGRLSSVSSAHTRIELLLPTERQSYRVDLGRTLETVPAATVRWSVGFDVDLLSE